MQFLYVFEPFLSKFINSDHFEKTRYFSVATKNPEISGKKTKKNTAGSRAKSSGLERRFPGANRTSLLLIEHGMKEHLKQTQNQVSDLFLWIKNDSETETLTSTGMRHNTNHTSQWAVKLSLSIRTVSALE